MTRFRAEWSVVLPLIAPVVAIVVALGFALAYVVLPIRTGIAKEKARPNMAPLVHQADAKAREVELRFKQAVLMLRSGHNEHALTALHRVLELAPDMPEAHVNMGFAMLGLKRAAAARDFFSAAIDLRPMQANAYYGLALSLEAQNDREGALGAMRSFIHLSKANDPFVRKARAALWEWQSAGTQGNKIEFQPPVVESIIARPTVTGAK